MANRNKKKENRYTFPENTYYFFREMCVREPLAALCFCAATLAGVLLPAGLKCFLL